MYIKNSKVYDFLKNLAQIYLPALGTLYFALAGIWGLPFGEQIVGTITAVDTFLGVCLGISKSSYIKAEAQEEIENSEDIGGESHVEKPDEEV